MRIFLVTLTNRTVAIVTLRQVGYHCHRVQLLTILPYVSIMAPMLWGEHPKISFWYTTKGEI